MEEARSYHHWECLGNQMGLWSQIGIAHLAIKMLFKCATATDEDLSRLNEVQELVTNFSKLPPYDIISYGIVSNIIFSKIKYVHKKYKNKFCFIILITSFFQTAIMLMIYLSKYTDFFKVINLKECLISKFDNDFVCDLATENDERLYVSSLLLRHILQLISNGHAITKINAIADKNKNKLLIQQQDRIATAIYPSASMMNHSCDPNIINR